ncbi:hypothetical protein NN561_019545 [Cricetulus griseus]
MELPAVNLKVAARPGRAGVQGPGDRSRSRREGAEPEGGGSGHREGHRDRPGVCSSCPQQQDRDTSPPEVSDPVQCSPPGPRCVSAQVRRNPVSPDSCSPKFPHAATLFHN